MLRLITSGFLPGDFTKLQLNEVVKKLVDKSAEMEPIKPGETEAILESLQNISERLSRLEMGKLGKSQAA